MGNLIEWTDRIKELSSIDIEASFSMSDEQRKAIFAKTVGAHSDSADYHSDQADFHTKEANALKGSNSPKAPALIKAHTAAADAHNEAGEAHNDAKSDIGLHKSGAANLASKKAFNLSSKIAKMPKPKLTLKAGGPGSGRHAGGGFLDDKRALVHQATMSKASMNLERLKRARKMHSWHKSAMSTPFIPPDDMELDHKGKLQFKKSSIKAGGPGSGRKPNFGTVNTESLEKLHSRLTKKGYYHSFSSKHASDAKGRGMIDHHYFKKDYMGNTTHAIDIHERTNGFHNLSEETHPEIGALPIERSASKLKKIKAGGVGSGKHPGVGRKKKVVSKFHQQLKDSIRREKIQKKMNQIAKHIGGVV